MRLLMWHEIRLLHVMHFMLEPQFLKRSSVFVRSSSLRRPDRSDGPLGEGMGAPQAPQQALPLRQKPT